MNTNNTKIKKISINDDSWIAFNDDLLMLGGTFLPSNIHITIYFGFKLERIKIHLTKNLKENRKIHVPLIEMCYSDLDQIFQIIASRYYSYFMGILKEIKLSELTQTGNYLFLFPEKDSQNEIKLLNNFKISLDPLIKERGIAKKKYHIDLDERKIEQIAAKLFYNQKKSSFLPWFKSNIFKPNILNNLNGCTGMIYMNNDWFGFIQMPTPDGIKNYILSKKAITLDNINLLKSIIGEVVFNKIYAKWKESIKRLRTSNDPNEFCLDKPIILRPLKKQNF